MNDDNQRDNDKIVEEINRQCNEHWKHPDDNLVVIIVLAALLVAMIIGWIYQ